MRSRASLVSTESARLLLICFRGLRLVFGSFRIRLGFLLEQVNLSTRTLDSRFGAGMSCIGFLLGRDSRLELSVRLGHLFVAVATVFTRSESESVLGGLTVQPTGRKVRHQID